MRHTYDLSKLNWELTGWIPEYWRYYRTMELGQGVKPTVPALPFSVPGSVQKALYDAGLIPDWNAGLNSLQCEWVENRHWIIETQVPSEWLVGGCATLVCNGLDYCGTVLLNDVEVGKFRNAFVPHRFDLTQSVLSENNKLRIIFECPPRWLGQFGYTSKMTDWKARFNYTWDWTSRLVQIGISGGIRLEVGDCQAIRDIRCWTELGSTGSLWVQGSGDVGYQIELSKGDQNLLKADVSSEELAAGTVFGDLDVQAWEPNPAVKPVLYQLILSSKDGSEPIRKTVGFKHIEWRQCDDAPAGAEPWICVVNGKPTFLQGVNWTPIRPNYADLTEEDYRTRLTAYREMGVNLLRVWGGAALETEVFYRLCDELGILVWQEFPLSSSGHDNWPPDDDECIRDLGEIARTYILRRQHHVSLLMWCGGNELQTALDGSRLGTGKPLDLGHPVLARFAEVVSELDPTRRFVPTSASGPRFKASADEFGLGLHHDVHGPWNIETNFDDWADYWRRDDSLFRSETGVPGASPVDIIETYRGDCDTFPASIENPLWRRTMWWIDWSAFIDEQGRGPKDLDEYVSWSSERQATALALAAEATKKRFPRCGGFLVWMGHDSFPCTANTSILDFWGRPKPAAKALQKVFLGHGIQ